MAAKYTSIDDLFIVLEWLMSQRPDSAYSRFSLFLVAFDNPQVLGSTFGAPDAAHRLNQFGKTVASGVRHTDLVARNHSDFWILAPECNADMVGCRLCEIAEKVKDFGLDVVQCSIGAYVFPLPYGDVTKARMLIDTLKKLPPAYKFDPTQECGLASLSKQGEGAVKWSGRSPETCARARGIERPPASS
jgi:hypothetical protein